MIRDAVIINFGNLWEYPIGTTVIINDNLLVYCNKGMCGKTFYDESSGIEVSEDDFELDDDTAIVIDKGPVDLARLCEIKKKTLIRLINEGYTTKSNSKFMDLEHYLNEYMELCKLLEIGK